MLQPDQSCGVSHSRWTFLEGRTLTWPGVLNTTVCDDSYIVDAALLLTTEDTLSRPMPHVYQIDAESHQATPIVVPEAVQQQTNAAVGSGIGSMSDVNVKDLRIIANQQVQLETQTPVAHSHAL